MLQVSRMWTSKTSALLRSSLGSSVLLVGGAKAEKSEWAGAQPLIAIKDGVKLSRKV